MTQAISCLPNIKEIFFPAEEAKTTPVNTEYSCGTVLHQGSCLYLIILTAIPMIVVPRIISIISTIFFLRAVITTLISITSFITVVAFAALWLITSPGITWLPFSIGIWLMTSITLIFSTCDKKFQLTIRLHWRMELPHSVWTFAP